MKKTINHICADFETTTSKTNDKKSEVYLWGAIDEKNIFYYDVNLASFFDYIDNIKETSIVYFHNGSGFDFEYLKHYIGSNLSITNESLDIKNKQAWIMAKNTSTTYSIHYRNKRGKMIYFKCSYLFLTCALDKLPNSKKIKKDEEFYTRERDYKHKNDVDKEDIEYLFYDVLTLKEAMDEYNIINKPRLQSYTATSVSWAKFKKSIGDFKEKYENQITLDEWKDLHQWANGAMCYLNPKYKQKLLRDVYTYDANSLYPWAMVSTYIPYGKPIYDCENSCTHDFKLLQILITAKIKKGFIPCLTTSNRFASSTSTNWKSQLKNDVIFITGTMWKTISQYYNIKKMKLIRKICFNSTLGFGQDYIYSQMAIKEKETGNTIKRKVAKNNMNSCFGRFMMCPVCDRWHFEEIKDTKLKKHQMAYGKYYMKPIETINEKIMYIPAGIAILSNAREYLIKHIQQNRENFVYCDTDSITICNGDTFKGEVHDSKLGMWKLESKGAYGYNIRLKMYVKANSKKELTEMKASGLDSKLTFKGKTLDDVLKKNIVPVSNQCKRVEGGKLILKTTKKVFGWLDSKGG